MLEGVRALMQLVRRNGFHHGIAAVVCSLLLFFAVGAKVAAYHTAEQGAKPIASAKMWQTSKAAPSEDETTTTTAQPVILLLMLLSVLAAGAVLLQRYDLVVRRDWHAAFPPLAVRPPPAL